MKKTRLLAGFFCTCKNLAVNKSIPLTFQVSKKPNTTFFQNCSKVKLSIKNKNSISPFTGSLFAI